MHKTLAVVVFLAVILPIYRQEKGSHPTGDQNSADTAEKPSLPPRTITCKVKNDGTTIECNWTETIPESYLKRLFSPENAPNIGLCVIGFLGVIAGVFTLIVIYCQVVEMRRQLRMSVDKERARIEIKAVGLELQRISGEFWNIKATIELRNVGAGRAYVRLGTGDLVMEGDDLSTESHSTALDVVNGFVDPISNPDTQSFYFFQPENKGVSEYARKICDGALRVYITEFIEYETVGTRFHRNFNYTWIGHGSPFSMGAIIFRDELPLKTDEERISRGYWLPNSWMAGRSRDNDEYELPPKKTKKKQDPN